jgi:hypothetical protein
MILEHDTRSAHAHTYADLANVNHIHKSIITGELDNQGALDHLPKTTTNKNSNYHQNRQKRKKITKIRPKRQKIQIETNREEIGSPAFGGLETRAGKSGTGPQNGHPLVQGLWAKVEHPKLHSSVLIPSFCVPKTTAFCWRLLLGIERYRTV